MLVISRLVVRRPVVATAILDRLLTVTCGHYTLPLRCAISASNPKADFPSQAPSLRKLEDTSS